MSAVLSPSFARTRILCGVLVFAGAFGCRKATPELPMIEANKSRTLPSEKAVDLSIELIGGALFMKPLAADSAELYRATLAHDLPQLEPAVTEKVEGERLGVRFDHGKYASSMGRARNEWRIDWTQSRRTRLTLTMLNGLAELDLGGFEIERADIRVDQGRLQLDFGNAAPKSSCEIVAEVGTGQVALRYPPDVGVRVRARKAVGGVQVEGLRQQGDAWVNDLYANHPVKLDFALGCGLGEVVVEPKR